MLLEREMVIGARALKTKDGIMRNHNRKRQSGTGQRNGCVMTCLIGLVKLGVCHAVMLSVNESQEM